MAMDLSRKPHSKSYRARRFARIALNLCCSGLRSWHHCNKQAASSTNVHLGFGTTADAVPISPVSAPDPHTVRAVETSALWTTPTAVAPLLYAAS